MMTVPASGFCGSPGGISVGGTSVRITVPSSAVWGCIFGGRFDIMTVPSSLLPFSGLSLIGSASLFGLAVELEIGQPDVFAHLDLVGAQLLGRLEAGACRGAGKGDDVVLLDAVAADTEAAGEHAVHVQRRAAGEEHDPVLAPVRSLARIRA